MRTGLVEKDGKVCSRVPHVKKKERKKERKTRKGGVGLGGLCLCLLILVPITVIHYMIKSENFTILLITRRRHNGRVFGLADCS